ncbi:MAG: hypothetical protein ACYDEX_19100 [Mobilitalea sp.]
MKSGTIMRVGGRTRILSNGTVVRYGNAKRRKTTAGKSILKRSAGTLMRASKMAGGWRTGRGVSLYGKAMMRLGFVAGVKKRR